jgi:hypothetical protein
LSLWKRLKMFLVFAISISKKCKYEPENFLPEKHWAECPKPLKKVQNLKTVNCYHFYSCHFLRTNFEPISKLHKILRFLIPHTSFYCKTFIWGNMSTFCKFWMHTLNKRNIFRHFAKIKTISFAYLTKNTAIQLVPQILILLLLIKSIYK